MARVLILLLLGFLIVSCNDSPRTPDEASPYSEKYRPGFHFTPESEWMNDPNGMVYYEDEYHLFYQYYPYGSVWGPMHWGHAVSSDLVAWEHLPIALYPDSIGQIFSGSCVIDWNNTSGFGDGTTPPMVAIFTYHDMLGEYSGQTTFQTQGVAYSLDKGRTWEKFKGNPVIPNTGIKDFRDPKVFWHVGSNQWIMSLAVKHEIYFYGSADLKEWTFLSAFGPEGKLGNVWECPDLFQLEVPGTDEKKWVLLVSINPSGPNGGSGTQYFIGDFDGQSFTNDNESDKILWLDFGRDNYAGVTWSDVPASDGRRLFIGWMSNWDYARLVPTSPWRSAMTISRELGLKQTPGGLRVVSKPINELESLRTSEQQLADVDVEGLLNISDQFPVNASGFEAVLEFEWGENSPFLGLQLSNDQGDEYRITFNARSGMFTSDRTGSGDLSFSEKFASNIHLAPVYDGTNRKSVKLHLFVDTSSIEVFANDGEVVMTETFFPREHFQTVSLFSRAGSAKVNGTFYSLKNIWTD